MSVRLSVNVNKVATLRNSRGGKLPGVIEAVRVCVEAGAPGITVHPRADRRHITPEDVREIAAELSRSSSVELNIEGDPRPELLALVRDVRPTQCTLVPVAPGEITSQAGWSPDNAVRGLAASVLTLKEAGVRVSLFIEPRLEAVRWAAETGADRVELYTEPFAREFKVGSEAGKRCFRTYEAAAGLAHAHGLGVNAGHDLDLENLALFRELSYLNEVSIGHALISHALFVGLERAVHDYLTALESGRPS